MINKKIKGVKKNKKVINKMINKKINGGKKIKR